MDVTVAVNQELISEITRLRAELTELRKPDCRMCAFYYACFTGRKVICCDGNEFDRLSDPVRLYEKE